jgi:predicted dehydrogenase
MTRKSDKSVNRRDFLAKTGQGAAAVTAALTVASPAVVRAKGLNERLRLGMLATGDRVLGGLGPAILEIAKRNQNIEIASACDVYKMNLEAFADQVKKSTGVAPKTTGDYRDVIADKSIDAVFVTTPDHWHAKMTLEALQSGKHVYCEKPMTHTVEEAIAVMDAWKKSGLVMQVGVHATADPRWREAYKFIRQGGIGKVIQAQTHYYRNSSMGEWRYYKLTPEMNPKNVDWDMFLGHEWGLAPKMPFDRAVFRQWRRYWPFGSGLMTTLFVHRLTHLLLATGLRFPRRVVGAGGIFLELDGREVPDTATAVIDYNEGVQIIVSASMCTSVRPLEICIRGHHGTVVFSGAPWTGDGFDFVPERSQVTFDNSLKPQHITAQPAYGEKNVPIIENFFEAIAKNDPSMVFSPPDVGAAAIVGINLAADCYRYGKVYEWDNQARKVVESGPGYAKEWEKLSAERAAPRHVPGWDPINKDPLFSQVRAPSWQKLEGPWPDANTDPAR